MTHWFDTHVHLDSYPLPERAALLERARECGVAVFAVATDLPSSRAVATMEGVRGRVVGIHPANAAPGFEVELAQLAREPGVVAVGECGFDDGGGGGWEDQEETFLAQCRLARELGKALVLHIDGAGAWEQLIANAAALDGLPVVRHYFTGGAEQAAWHRERVHYLSFGNPLRRDRILRDIARDYPAELLLIETDSYPLPGRSTEPKDVAKVGETLAIVRGWKVDEARQRLAANTAGAFALEPRA